jgi:hypothetical protein
LEAYLIAGDITVQNRYRSIQAWKWCRQQSLSALAYWAVTYTPLPGIPADMLPHQRSLVFIERLSHAVDDLEAPYSFD